MNTLKSGFVTVTYEHLQDNTSDTKVATTSFSTFNVSAQYLPRTGYLTLTASFGHFSSGNGVGAADPDPVRRASAIDEATNRIFLQASQAFEYHAKHIATFTGSWSDRNDETFRNLDTRTTMLGARLMVVETDDPSATLRFIDDVRRDPLTRGVSLSPSWANLHWKISRNSRNSPARR